MATAACLLAPFLLDGRPPVDSPKKLTVESRALIDLERRLFLAAKSSGNFAQPRKRSGLLPAGLERPPNSESIREQERSGLKMIAVIHGGMKKNPALWLARCWGAVFRPAYLHLHFLGKCTRRAAASLEAAG